MGIEEQLMIIRRNDFLARLNHEDYEWLNIMHNFIIADKDAFIYFDAQYHNKLYFIKEGFVKIGNVDDDGNDLVKEILQPGDVFGQFTLEPNNMQGEFAQAHKSGCVLCAFTIHDFEKLLDKRPDLSIVFSKKVGQKMKRLETRLLNLLQRDVRTRLLYFFWTMLPAGDKKDLISVTLDNYLTHEDIARLICTTRQSVSTLVSQLSDEGILEMNRRHIVIHNVKLLQKEAKVG